MAAARYWRLIGIDTAAGGDLELSEIALYSGGSRIDGSATLSCSHTPVWGALSDLKDGDTSTRCRFAAADVRSAGFFLQWDFGIAVDVTAVRIGSSANAGEFVDGCSLMQSASPTGWLTVAEISGVVFPGANTLTTFGATGVIPTTWSPIDKASGTVLSNGNLTANCSGADNGPVKSVFGASSGKWYWELTRGGGIDPIQGVATSSWVRTDYPGYGANSLGYYGAAVPKKIKDAARADYGAEWKLGVTLGVSLDMDAGTISISIGGVSQGVMFSGLSGTFYAVMASASTTSSVVTANFGASPLVYTPPTGHRAGFGVELLALPLTTAPKTRTPLRGFVCAASAAVGVHQAINAQGILVAREIEFGGQGRIYGTTKTKGTPNAPTKARVVLLHQRSKMLVRETWSDPATGYFEFAGIDLAQQFLTLAEDAAGNFRPVAASRLAPEVPA